MEGEAAIKKSFDTVSILVVDHDTTSLAMIATILRDFNYRVVTVEHPNEALRMLRTKSESLDLVISDLHTPGMNGIELTQVISREFDLPVILISSEDESDSNVLNALENGAVFVISKPVCLDDLRDVWQFPAMMRISNKAIVAPPSPSKRKDSNEEE